MTDKIYKMRVTLNKQGTTEVLEIDQKSLPKDSGELISKFEQNQVSIAHWHNLSVSVIFGLFGFNLIVFLTKIVALFQKWRCSRVL